MKLTPMVRRVARGIFDRMHNNPPDPSLRLATRMTFGFDHISYDTVVKGVEQGLFHKDALLQYENEARSVLRDMFEADSSELGDVDKDLWRAMLSNLEGR